MGLLKWLGGTGSEQDPELAPLAGQVHGLRTQVEGAEREMAALELEMRLLGEACQRLRRGMDLQQGGEALLDLLQGPLELATFYVSRFDPVERALHFPVYFEGGRLRRHGSVSLRTHKGLTGRALESREPLYVRDMTPEGVALGAQLSRAEEITGIIAQTWYGIPMSLGGGEPLAFTAFQVAPRDGFPESRRAFLQRIARLLALAAAEECP